MVKVSCSVHAGRSRLVSGRFVVLALTAIGVLVAQAAVLLVAARSSGVSYWGTSVALIVGFPICALTTTYVGWWIHEQGDRTVGRWVLAIAGSVLLYLIAVAGVTWAVAVQRRASLLLDWLAIEALGGCFISILLGHQMECSCGSGGRGVHHRHSDRHRAPRLAPSVRVAN